MTSTIILYYGSKVIKDKNFILDYSGTYYGITDYLNTLTKTTITNFQYVKHSLSLSIKLNLSQSNLEMGKSANDMNYCKITNGTENPKFYFIMNKIWRSENTIELVLLMDTLNSFKYGVEYAISKKTFIKRQHKDRFALSSYDSDLNKYYLIRKIDLKSEEINAPLYRGNFQIIQDGSGVDWKLYYKNSSNPGESPVDCYLVPNEPVKLEYISSDGVLDENNLPSGYYCIFFYDYNTPSLVFDVDGVQYSPENSSAGGYSIKQAIAFLNDGGTIKAYWMQCSYNGQGSVYGSWTTISNNVSNITMNTTGNVLCHKVSSLPNASTIVNNTLWLPVNAETTLVTGGTSTQVVYGDNSIDKTLESNIKIINCPYSPTPFTIDSDDVFTFDSCWSYNVGDGKLKLSDFNKRFKNHVVCNYVFDVRNDLIIECTPSQLGNNVSRHFKDSKLFHSDFYRPKFVYDSFVKVFPLEQMSTFGINKNTLGKKLEFDFVMSRNIVSKFLFKFDFTWSNPIEDYPNIICVSRNNEEVLYSSQYLNYVRTGFNFDQKAKERQDAMAGVGIGLNVAGLVASGIIGVATGNPLAIGSAVGSGIGLVNQLVSYAKTSVQNEENIQRKLAESKMQSVAVLNADDYDLLYEYTSNKAYMTYYTISSQMESILDDLFYYGGYVVNAQDIPNVTSRYWFNYLEANLVIDNENNIPEDIMNDIIEKFNNGVTFLHGHVITGYQYIVFDLNQEKENMETSLVI